METAKTILRKFIKIQDAYSHEKRNLVTPERYKYVAEAG